MSRTSRMRLAMFERIPPRLRPAANFHYYRLRSLLDRELPVVCRFLRPGLCAVDVGANNGVYTYAFARTGARVEAFEPEPGCAAVLTAYARRHANVGVHADALGVTEGRALLHVPQRDGLGVTGHATLARSSAPAIEHEVRVRTLDSFDFEHVALIKIDVEGWELDVIAGARRTIARAHPVLLVELERRHLRRPLADAFAAIVSLGYAGTFLHPTVGRLPLSAFDERTHQDERHADIPGALYINNFIFEPTT